MISTLKSYHVPILSRFGESRFFMFFGSAINIATVSKWHSQGHEKWNFSIFVFTVHIRAFLWVLRTYNNTVSMCLEYVTWRTLQLAFKSKLVTSRSWNVLLAVCCFTQTLLTIQTFTPTTTHFTQPHYLRLWSLSKYCWCVMSSPPLCVTMSRVIVNFPFLQSNCHNHPFLHNNITSTHQTSSNSIEYCSVNHLMSLTTVEVLL